MSKTENRTSIKIRESTRDRLAEVGFFGESYDDVITRLLAMKGDKVEDDENE